jgi:hypothetical protein
VSGVRPGGLEDRYVAPLEANRRGAHRARPNPLLGMLPLVAVAAVVIAVAGGIITLVGGDGLLPSKGGNTVAGSTIAATKTARPSTTPSATARTPAKSAKPSTSPSSGPSSPTTSAGGSVDRSVKVTVHNATGTKGLAAKVTAHLVSDSWTKVITAQGRVTFPSKTTVYYASSDLKATAEALINDELGGVGVSQLSTKQSRNEGSIGVFIGSDYTP